MSRTERNKCYMCNASGTTREHVPPSSFFPKGYRKSLITVPSCPDHNTKNNLDVEYIRNAIVIHITTNDLARGHFQSKVIRSFINSPRLFELTFKDVVPIIVEGQESGIFTCDISRFNVVMKAIAYAVYFKSFGKTHSGNWKIFSSSLVFMEDFLQHRPDGYDELRQFLGKLSFTEVPMPQSEIFRCGFLQGDEARFVYQFIFYEGFVVYALAMPPATNAL